MEDIPLVLGRMSAVVRPALGGSLVSLDEDDAGPRALLRNGRDPRDPRQSALFPLVPWANRIFGGGFDVQGSRVGLAPDSAGPHVHGYGWRACWTVEERTESTVRLSHVHESEGGYAYEALLRYCLLPDGLDVELSVRNRADRAMPFGLGLHPYFKRHADTWVHAVADGVWRSDADLRPLDVGPLADDLTFDRSPLPTRAVNDLLTGWSGDLLVGRGAEEVQVRMSVPDCHLLHLYAPLDADFFCLEPVTHAIDAHNHGRMPAPLLNPNDSTSLAARFNSGGGH